MAVEPRSSPTIGGECELAREARVSLARVLESDEFRNAENIRSFLTYVVEETLAGREKQLKGYTIAVNALGRRPDFDPANDPIVRVEANRLRKMLTAYYADLGRHDPLRIVLTPGSYIPAFVMAGAPQAEAPAPAPAPSADIPVDGPPSRAFEDEPAAARLARVAAAGGSGRGVVGLSVAFGAMVVAVFVLALALISDVSLSRRPVMAAGEEKTRACSRPQGAAAGHLMLSVNVTRVREPAFDVDAVALRLREALARFDLIEVIAPDDCGVRLQADYNILLRADAGAAGPELVVTLIRTRPEGIAWSRVFQLGQGREIMGMIAHAVKATASTIGSPGGVAFSDRLRFPEAASTLQVCVAIAHVYYRTISPPDLRRLMECFTQVERENPNGLWATVVRGYLAISDHWRGNPATDGRPQIERAVDFATLALHMAPSSARAHHILSQASFARGDFPEAIRLANRAMEMNGAEPEIEADIGSRLIGAGFFQEGVSLIERATSYMSTPLEWHTFHLYVAARHAGDTQRMDMLIGRLVSDAVPFGQAAAFSRHAAAGRMPEAAAALRRLRQHHPNVATNFGAVLRRYLASPAVAEPLVRDFEEALARIGS